MGKENADETATARKSAIGFPDSLTPARVSTTLARTAYMSEGKTVKPFNIQDLDMSKAEDRKKYAEYRKQRDSAPVQINLNNK